MRWRAWWPASSRAPIRSEVLVTLAGGEALCATVANQELQQLKLQPGSAVHALFNADRAIVATLC